MDVVQLFEHMSRMFSTVSLVSYVFMRSVLDSMIVTVAMIILCMCLICDNGAGGELFASRVDILQGCAYF